jgi:hypothetical protein
VHTSVVNRRGLIRKAQGVHDVTIFRSKIKLKESTFFIKTAEYQTEFKMIYESSRLLCILTAEIKERF